MGTGNLSGKEWQALVDVIRTTEVLLSGEIPGKAIKKIKASAATNTATEDEDSDDAMRRRRAAHELRARFSAAGRQYSSA